MKNGNILENMREFHQAMADGETIQMCIGGDWDNETFELYAIKTIGVRIEHDLLRIKPESLTTYYRVYRTADGGVYTDCRYRPFPDFEEWLRDRNTVEGVALIKDFEVTE